MQTVYICNDNEINETAKFLTAMLKSANYSFAEIKEDSVSVHNSKDSLENFIIIENKKVEKITTDCPIVLNNTGFSEEKLSFPQNFISIINTDSEKWPSKMISSGVNTITCGLSAKNTVTFSSFENECAVISLQRAVTTLSGDLYEPCEVPIVLSSLKSLPENSKYPLLSAAAVLFLVGTEFSENGLII